MKILQVSVLLLAAALGGTARAQLPFPLPGEPGPDLSRRPACTSAYVRSIEQQVAAMRKLRSAGPEAVNRLCTLIELGGAWLGGELPEDLRGQLKGALGFDVDLQRMAAQCRAGQGMLERELIGRLGFLRSELVRCNDTI
jgi:hypothetical protein